MPVSTAPASQAELVELLRAELADADSLHVSFAGSGKLPKVFELVVVLPSRDYSRSRGEQYMVEVYDLAARIEVFRPGADSAADADGRRWELIDAIDGVLRDVDYHGYRTKGGEVRTSDETLDPYEKGWVASSLAFFSIETLQRG